MRTLVAILSLSVFAGGFAAADPGATRSPLWEDVVHPNYARCETLLGEARGFLDRRSFAVAGERLTLVSQLCPSFVEAFVLLGQAQVGMGEMDAAARTLARARTLRQAENERGSGGSLIRPEDGRLAFHLGFVRSVLGQLDEAIAEYRRAERIGSFSTPERATLLYNLGDDLMALGRLSEAIACYRRAIRTQPPEPMFRFALAVALDRDQQPAASRAELQVALSLDAAAHSLSSGQYAFIPPEEVHYYRALVDRATGQIGQARAELRSFLAALPNSPYAARARDHLTDWSRSDR